MYKYIFSNLDPTVFNSEVQICRYEGLDQVQIDQGIDQNEWGQWDIHTLAEKNAIPCQVHVNIFPVTDSESETSSDCSNDNVSTVGYDITADMVIDCDLDLDSLNESVNEPSVNEIPLPDRDTVMAELNVLGGDQSPPADFVMPTDYYPASPIYSPASPAAQSSSMSPTNSIITVNNNTDSESEHGFTPAQNDGPIITGGGWNLYFAPIWFRHRFGQGLWAYHFNELISKQK